MVLIVDVPHDRVREELYLGTDAKRFTVAGHYDKWATKVIPAKHLRADLRRAKLSRAHDEDQRIWLSRWIERNLDDGERDAVVMTGNKASTRR